MPFELDIDTGFWMQSDLMRHSITLYHYFLPGPPFRVFSPPGYPFLPTLPFQVFDLPGVQIFFISSLIFARTLLVRREALIFA